MRGHLAGWPRTVPNRGGPQMALLKNGMHLPYNSCTVSYVCIARAHMAIEMPLVLPHRWPLGGPCAYTAWNLEGAGDPPPQPHN